MTSVRSTRATTSAVLELDGVRVERALIRGGFLPPNPPQRLRIIATLGAGWDLHLEKGDRRHYDHGELVLLPPWLQRQPFFREAADNLLITFESRFVERLAGEVGLTDYQSVLPFQKLTDATVYRLVAAVADEIGPTGHRGQQYTSALVNALIGHIVRGRLAAPESAGTAKGLSPRRLQLCQQYIEQHLGERLSVDSIAAVGGLSTYHFARVFKQATGKTPHQYILERRIALAQLSIRNTTRPLNEISEELGFRNASHFSAVFMEHTGMTPSEHRLRGEAQQI
jgi:AraC family transcriptional regulator